MKAHPPARTHRYAASVSWSGPAGGSTKTYAGYSREHALTFDGKEAVVRGSADPAFRGDPALLNPEELLVASLAACHLLSYLAVCALEGIEILSYVDNADGRMTETSGEGRFVEVTLRPEVRIAREADRSRALALHDRARAACFIANSVNFPVHHEPVILT
jgi:organic hydroperoxide reductase OsmC/OhrA